MAQYPYGTASYPGTYPAPPHHYRWLRVVGTLYGILGWIVLVGSVIAGILVALGAASTDVEMYRYGAQRVSPLVAFFIFVAFVIGGIVTALPMLAFKDLVALLVDLASDARRTADATTHLLSTAARPPQ